MSADQQLAVRRVLAALARGTLGPDYVPEVPERMLSLFQRVSSASERDRLLALLARLDRTGGSLAFTGRRAPVSWMGAAEAEAVLQRWASSRFPMMRRVSTTITSAAALSLYAWPGPAWERLGYRAPSGHEPRHFKRLTTLTTGPGEVLSCDVVVVGSGAGGGCTAAILAGAGLDVVVLEKGGYFREPDFTHIEGEATRDLYLYGMTLSTDDLGCRIIAGSTLGGGTVVNYTTSFRAPRYVLEEWARVSGIESFVNGEIDESFDAVGERLNVNTDSSAAGKRDELLEQGLKSLGWHVDSLPRAVKGCSQDEACGYCGFGCRIGGKQSTMRTYLEDAQAAGARIVVRADATRVLIQDGVARGVEARTPNGNLTVKARAVVASAGAIETPALLLRSGMGGRVGHDLRLHPGAAALGVFDDDVRMWEGTTQARYSSEFAEWDGGRGPLFETVPIHLGAGAAGFPWLSAADHRRMMDRFPKTSFCAVLPRDESSGRVVLNRDGSPRVHYALCAADQRRVVEGIVRAGEVMEHAGAREVYTTHKPRVSYTPRGPHSHREWAERVRAAGAGKGALTFFSYHQMGSCRMGVDPSSSAIGPDNQSHEVRNLFVADASTFPTASGVNPMLSVYAIAHRAAGKLAARLA